MEFEYKRKTDAEIHRLAIDYIAGTLITSIGMTDRQIRSSFPVLALVRPKVLRSLLDVVGERGFVYGYAGGGHLANRRYVLWAANVIDSEDSDRFLAKVAELKPGSDRLGGQSEVSRRLVVEIHWHPSLSKWHYQIREPGIERTGWADAGAQASDAELLAGVARFEVLGRTELVVERVAWCGRTDELLEDAQRASDEMAQLSPQQWAETIVSELVCKHCRRAIVAGQQHTRDEHATEVFCSALCMTEDEMGSHPDGFPGSDC